MENNKKIILAVVLIAIIAVIFFIQDPFAQKSTVVADLENDAQTGIDIGDKAPDFALLDINDNVVKLSDFRGKKAAVVNFWATWCPPCRDEMPAFEDIFVRNKDDMTILGVNLQESKRAISNFLLEIPVTYPLLLDPDEEVKAQYNIFTQPVTYFIDKNGVIVDKKFGPLTEGEIEEKFAKLGVQ